MTDRHITIRVYDDEGSLCESLGGRLGYDEIREYMLKCLENDGIPVLRVDEPAEELLWEPEAKKPGPAKCKDLAPAPVPLPRIPLPLKIEWEYPCCKFAASGDPQDVLEAHDAYMAHLETLDDE